MQLIKSIQTISLYPYVDSTLGCFGKPQTFPADMKGRFVKRKKLISLVRFKRAGFAWVNNTDIAKEN